MRFLLVVFLAPALLAQQFEAAKIEPTKLPRQSVIGSDEPVPGWNAVVPPGISPKQPYPFGTSPRFAAMGYNLRWYLTVALGVKKADSIVGVLPPDGWDLSATAGKKVALDEERAMLLQFLIAEFGLTLNKATKETKACVVKAAPTGLKLTPTESASSPLTYSAGPGEFTLSIHFHGATLDSIVDTVGNLVGTFCTRPVVSGFQPSDKRYDFDLRFVNIDRAAMAHKEPEAGPNVLQALRSQAGITITEEQAQVPIWEVLWSGKFPE